MSFEEMLQMSFWNGLAKTHLPELIMVLTAGVVALVDRYIRKAVSKFTSSMNAVSRFFVFLLVCSVGYTALALFVAFALKAGLTYSHGAYTALGVLAVFLVVAFEAQRQKQI